MIHYAMFLLTSIVRYAFAWHFAFSELQKYLHDKRSPKIGLYVVLSSSVSNLVVEVRLNITKLVTLLGTFVDKLLLPKVELPEREGDLSELSNSCVDDPVAL